MEMPRSILVPTDFSDSADAALEYAVGLAQRFGATVELLHVAEPPRVMAPEMVGSVLEGEIETADELMAQRLSDLNRRGVHGVDGRVVVGAAVEVILREAARADLIVMGTHGRGSLASLVLGSVAATVSRRAAAPVLIVREKPAALRENVSSGRTQ